MNEIVKIESSLPSVQLTDVKSILEKFLSGVDVKPITRESYRTWLRHYIDWLMQNKILLTQATNADLINYKQYLLKEAKPFSTENSTDKNKISVSSIASFLTAVRKLYTWLHVIGVYPVNIAANLKAPKSSSKKLFKKNGLTKEQTLELFNWSEKNQTIKEYAIVSTLVLTGIREIELVRANIGDIVMIGGKRCLKIQGKGRDEKDEFVIIVDILWERIKKYLATRKLPQPSEALFISDAKMNKGKGLTTRTIQYICREALDALCLYKQDGYTTHSLRHTFAHNLLRAGGSAEEVQWVLRHASADTTLAYINAMRQERRIANSPEEKVEEYLSQK